MFKFGEVVNGYEQRVFNEQEVRASAGILFLFAIISFLNSWLIGDFELTRVFVVAFLIDFFIRLFINPRYAPSLIIARFFIKNKNVQYIEAAPKKMGMVFRFYFSNHYVLFSSCK